MDATDAGYADLIMTGIDKVKGGFEDLPPHLQQVMIELRTMSKIEGINLEMTMQVRVARRGIGAARRGGGAGRGGGGGWGERAVGLGEEGREGGHRGGHEGGRWVTAG